MTLPSFGETSHAVLVQLVEVPTRAHFHPTFPVKIDLFEFFVLSLWLWVGRSHFCLVTKTAEFVDGQTPKPMSVTAALVGNNGKEEDFDRQQTIHLIVWIIS